mgnify:CR=1 FL=1
MTTDDKIDKLMVDVEVIKSKMNDFTKYVDEDICKITEDHETRIRSLESFKSKFIGAIILGNVLTGIVVALIVAFITRGH